MKDKIFLDTNIFVYSFLSEESYKKESARSLIKESLKSHNGIISYQVIQEFSNVAFKGSVTPVNGNDIKLYIEKILLPLCSVWNSFELINGAIDIKERWQYSFYDSLIVAAALEAKCNKLFSEDLQHDQKIFSLEIINPFLKK